MEDFAALLLEARARAGKTQAQVALAAGLTPSYLSFIENRKKPPPSDDVCERLAEVLGLPAKRLIEVAHLERAPRTVRKRLRSLSTTLKRERKSRLRILKSLLSPFLFAGPPGYLESAVDSLAIPSSRRRRIREVLRAVGRHRADREAEVSRIIEELPERERAVLLEALPDLLARNDRPPDRPTAPPDREPRLHYGPPEKPSEPYLLEVTLEMAEEVEEARAGDRVVVDPAAAARPGDLVVLRSDAGPRLRRVEGGEPSLRNCAGTVVELRRRLRSE